MSSSFCSFYTDQAFLLELLLALLLSLGSVLKAGTLFVLHLMQEAQQRLPLIQEPGQAIELGRFKIFLNSAS